MDSGMIGKVLAWVPVTTTMGALGSIVAKVELHPMQFVALVAGAVASLVQLTLGVVKLRKMWLERRRQKRAH